MMNPVPWLQMTNMISYQGLVRTFLKAHIVMNKVHPSRSNFRDLDDYLKQFSNLERLDTAIPLDKSIPAKFGEGLGIVEHLTTRHGRAGNAMRSLFLDMRKALDEVQ
ncbi:hypothetical protein [Citrobacter freundii]|uniref:hypothetical protein n=1 Tax=Citrobacter freundii TaxID=546 RepID=UPI00388D47A1